MRTLLIGLTLGGLIGWSLGYLKLPYLEESNMFWLGVMTCFAFIVLLLITMLFWNKKELIFNLFGRKTNSSSTKTEPKIYLIVLMLTSLAAITIISFQNRHNNSLKSENNRQEELIQKQSTIIQSDEANAKAQYTYVVLNQVYEEVKKEGKISNTTIERIIALSISLKPHMYFIGDSLFNGNLSPERGQLLIGLCSTDIDSASFALIKQKATFANASLEGVVLKGVNLNDINLKGAYLKNINLNGASLENADLQECNLWGADLQKANMNGIVLVNSNLSWTNLNEASILSANLNGAKLSNAKLRKADLRESSFQWAKLNGALLDNANLMGSDFFSTDFEKANLSQAILKEARIRKANFKLANLKGVELENATVEKNWEEKLFSWKALGMDIISMNYQVIQKKSSRFGKEKYLLKKRSRNNVTH